MKPSNYKIIIHIIGCISFFLLPLLFFPTPSRSFNVLNNPPSQRDFIGQLLLIAFFYLNYFLLIPKFYFPKKYFIFSVICLSAIFLIILIPSLLTHHNFFAGNYHQPPPGNFRQPPPDFYDRMQPPNNDNAPFFPEISHDIFLFFVVLFLSLSLRINNRLKQVQQEKTDAELSYLKSQINPHFLFNTLNLIYSLTIKKSENAPEAVVKLANMMRYVLYESSKNFVQLQNEINYIKDYIELQQTRFGNSIKLVFDISGDVLSNKKIAPLILIPFVENAFKHGINSEENSIIEIHIGIEKSNIKMNVYNTKVSMPGLNKEEGGVGIINTKNRLHLLYPNNYELNVTDKDKSYSVYLKLHLYD